MDWSAVKRFFKLKGHCSGLEPDEKPLLIEVELLRANEALAQAYEDSDYAEKGPMKSGRKHKEEGKMKMVFPHSMVTIALVLMLASYVKAHVGLFDIRKYGAIPNGDTTMDLQNAWRDACVSMTPSKVVVPSEIGARKVHAQIVLLNMGVNILGSSKITSSKLHTLSITITIGV
ncbi:hypothetical protein JHK82_039900 [Glycine max]|nr:hypothetical protein JHK86_040096 [Glycine max]KAG4965703.1 hypothetical protein JHK85_040678 [Glycine max]KAG5110677.1 hypothetical protein JHK82_039900 [Glycine max]